MIDTIHFEALRAIGLGEAMCRQLDHGVADPWLRPMRVIEVQRAELRLHDGRALRRAVCLPSLARELAADDDALAVGDWVLARADGVAGAGGCTITCRLLPHSRITRRTRDGGRRGDQCGTAQRQVLVSNVDTALLVMGLDHDFQLRRLERYLALARLSGVAAVLVLSKADTVAPELAAQRLAQVADLLPQRLPALALDLRDDQAAAAVRADDSRGRHTTTARSLLLLPGGACIIDTPGLRALRLDVVDANQLADAFGDVARHAPLCSFRDCQHRQEPACAVRDAVPETRLFNFQKLLHEASRDSQATLERRAQRARWKARGRAGQAPARAKRTGHPGGEGMG